VTGRVQGVGFRPTVYRQATALGLSGFVRNTPSGVVIEVEGAEQAVDRFVAQLQAEPPRQARIEALQVSAMPACGRSVPFEIKASERSGDVQAGMPPDLATCPDCRAELFDPKDRRFGYPFINCTNCGPRFTIIRELPYDRERTSMAEFRMCSDCKKEFEDPADRRFDAQPNACAMCGPRVELISGRRPAHRSPWGEGGTADPPTPERYGGQATVGGGSEHRTSNIEHRTSNEEDAIQEAVRLLKAGGIIAVKGVGGYHLCCDAANDAAISRLRARKHRPAKSLAVMFASLDQIRQYCEISAIEERELTGQAAPIVVVRRKSGSSLSGLLPLGAGQVSPDTDDLGVFLPYAPLHHLLLAEISPLIMTSGNLAEEPIAKDEQELNAILGPVADGALIHNRAIVRRCDDSVLKIVAGQRLFLRRSRGIVPDAIGLPLEGPAVLACGAELKNTVCITRGAQAFLSQHIGDLDDYRAYRFFRETVEDFSALLKVKPTIVAYDLHPDYLATRYALAREGVRQIGVQHHHAHIAACMAEHGLTERVIGVALDGTGFGPDGTIWGGEFLVADLADFRRVGHFKPYRMPGGAEAIRQPARMALSYGLAELPENGHRELPDLLPGLAENECRVLAGIIAQGVNAPWTSSAGRLFDAVAALLGLGETITYEAQAAIRLQTLARPDGVLPYSYAIEIQDDGFQLSFGPAIREIVADRRANVDRGRIAGGFYQTVAEAVGEMCVRIRDRERLEAASRLERVALSGGVFQNDLLLALVTNDLRRRGFQVYSHHLVPPNDGGIALGQAAVALARTDDIKKARGNL